MSLKTTLRQLMDWRLEHKIWRMSEKREKKALKINDYPTGKTEGEDAYIKKWAPLVRFSSPYAYRLFSNYCGNTSDILSQNATLIINETLNPKELQLYYSNKNVFDKVFPIGSMPKTILRKMKGLTLNASYENVNLTEGQFRNLLKEFETVVLKPTIDSDSGRGVVLFHKRSDGHFSHNAKN